MGSRTVTNRRHPIRIVSAALLVVFLASLSGCAQARVVNLPGGPTRVQPYGIFSEISGKDGKLPGVQYKLSVENLILSAIFVETIVVPIVLCGWYLWEPVGPS